VNVSPSVAETPAFLEAVAHNFDPARLVIEITEHAPVDDYRQLAGALRPLRNAGARLAIDDAGAGFASLRHVLRLSPDFIKLDLSLVHHIDADPVRRALATSLITFAGEVGATIVAEGIETRFELETLVALGVRYGQGFHLGRPGALP
jgi:EAL domain-containing protein (putative c-di-GMP-specific phosphodiesterase class I)